MEKIKMKKIENFEKRLLSWMINSRYKIILLLIATVFFGNISRLPYLNLIFTRDISFLIITVISLIIFRIKIIHIFMIGILLLLPTFLLQIIGKTALAEFIANCIYIIFLVGVIKAIIKDDTQR